MNLHVNGKLHIRKIKWLKLGNLIWRVTARVSSTTQDLELQKHELLKAGCEKIFSESVSGKDNNRTELIKMIDSLSVSACNHKYKFQQSRIDSG